MDEDATERQQHVLEAAEAAGEPAVFRSCVQHWPALHKWRGANGLRGMSANTRDATVQVCIDGLVGKMIALTSISLIGGGCRGRG